MQKPNIFKYATSELSQDAIICYILEWTKIENKKQNEQLHNLAINFMNSLFEKFSDITKPFSSFPLSKWECILKTKQNKS